MNADKALELARLAYPNDENLRVSYMLGVDKGYEFCREEMLKDAVEADIMLTLHDKTGDISLHTGYLPKKLGIKCNDKVRIIVLKAEEE